MKNMKIFILIITIFLLSADAYAGCGIIEINRKQKIVLAVRVDRISAVSISVRKITLLGDFSNYTISFPKKADAFKMLKLIKNKIEACQK